MRSLCRGRPRSRCGSPASAAPAPSAPWRCSAPVLLISGWLLTALITSDRDGRHHDHAHRRGDQQLDQGETRPRRRAPCETPRSARLIATTLNCRLTGAGSRDADRVHRLDLEDVPAEGSAARSFSGEPQPCQRRRSTLQKKAVPGCPVASMKRKTGRRFLVLKPGPKVISVCGGDVGDRPVPAPVLPPRRSWFRIRSCRRRSFLRPEVAAAEAAEAEAGGGSGLPGCRRAAQRAGEVSPLLSVAVARKLVVEPAATVTASPASRVRSRCPWRPDLPSIRRSCRS